MSSPPRATVARVRNVYLVPREHRAPGEVRDRLDRAARAAITGAVRAALAGAAAPDDERVWFIRRLDLDFALDPGADPTVLVGAWAAHLSRALAARLAAGPDDETVVVFPSREAFVARYLADRACGASHRHWYYAEFDSLAVLPTGTAVRTALAREPARAAGVLRQLAHARALELVLRALSVPDARAVWQLLAPRDAPGPVPAAAVDALLAALPRAGLRPADGPAAPHNALRLFAAARAGSATTEELHRGVEQLLAAAVAISRGEAAGESDLSPVHRDGLCRLLVPEHRPATPGAGIGPRVIASPFAGLFLAWGVFASSGLSSLCRTATFRYLVALKILGRSRVAEAWQDPAVLLASGLDRPPAPAEWRAFAESPGRVDLARDLIRWHWRRGNTSGVVAVERIGDVLVLGDARTGAWLHAAHAPAEADASDAVRGGLALLASATNEEWGVAVEAPSADRRARASVDAAYSSLAGCAVPPGLDAGTDLLGTLVARATLRAFASRLRGFGESSAEHVHRNFLAAPGDLRLGDETVVRVDPPPLHVVLRLGGHDEDTFTLTDGRRARVTVSPD